MVESVLKGEKLMHTPTGRIHGEPPWRNCTDYSGLEEKMIALITKEDSDELMLTGSVAHIHSTDALEKLQTRQLDKEEHCIKPNIKRTPICITRGEGKSTKRLKEIQKLLDTDDFVVVDSLTAFEPIELPDPVQEENLPPKKHNLMNGDPHWWKKSKKRK